MARIGLPLIPPPKPDVCSRQSQGSIAVIATVESQPYITASGSISGNDPPATPPGTPPPPPEDSAKFAGSAAVAIGIFTNDAQAFIAENASR